MAGRASIAKQEIVAKLIVESDLTIEAIAERADTTPQSIYNWKKTEDFQNLITLCRAEYRKRIETTGIANLENRLDALGDRWRRMKRIIEERSRSPEMANVPGGQTGLIVHQVKGVGKGEDFQIVDEYVVDTGLLKEMREHEKQAAQELGQWVEKKEHSGNVTFNPITLDGDKEAAAD